MAKKTLSVEVSERKRRKRKVEVELPLYRHDHVDHDYYGRNSTERFDRVDEVDGKMRLCSIRILRPENDGHDEVELHIYCPYEFADDSDEELGRPPYHNSSEEQFLQALTEATAMLEKIRKGPS